MNDALADNAEVQSMLGGVLNNLGFIQQQLGTLASIARLLDTLG